MGTLLYFLCWARACSSPKSNCFDDVVISRIADYNEIVTAANGNRQDAANYFNSSSWKNVFPDLDADEGVNAENINYLNKLKSGNYDLIKYTDSSTPNNVHFLAGDAATVTTSNAEFDLQVDISGL